VRARRFCSAATPYDFGASPLPPPEPAKSRYRPTRRHARDATHLSSNVTDRHDSAEKLW